MTDPCNCEEDWRLELLDLASGKRLGFLPTASWDMEELLNDQGTGTIIANITDTTAAKTWPHLRAVAFTRVSGPGASKMRPVCEYLGMIETFDGSTENGLQFGLYSIEYYLKSRLLRFSLDGAISQTEWGSDIVNYAAPGGIPLVGVDDGSATLRDISIIEENDQTVLDFITQLTMIDGGPDFYRRYIRSGTSWSTELHFADHVGNTTPRSINAKRGLTAYGINVDASEHANYVIGRDQDLNSSVADGTATSIYPRFEKAVKYSDLLDNGPNVGVAVDGELANNKDPITIPDLTVSDFRVSTAFALGDAVDLSMDNGALFFQGGARIVGKAWAQDGTGATTCTFSMVPTDDVTTAILNPTRRKRTPRRDCC